MGEREKQKEQTRAKIMQAAARCFTRKGYEGSSVADIAKEAGIAQGALYTYFKSKAELFIAIIVAEHGQGTDKAKEALAQGSSFAGVLGIMESCIRDVGFPVDHRLWTEILAVAARNDEVRAAFRQSDEHMRLVFEELLRVAVKQGEIREDIDIKATAIWLYALVDGLIARVATDPNFVWQAHLPSFESLVKRALSKKHAPKTLRLLFPQWQGGYDESEFPSQIYPLGARLLAWLAPASDAPLYEVPVTTPCPVPAPTEGGVFYREQILAQIRAALTLLTQHKPDRVITFGGDCLVSQAPFSYLNERYQGDMAVVWIDAHPDVSTPADFNHAHAMVLGNLLGSGEEAMRHLVPRYLEPKQVILAGVDGVLDYEAQRIAQYKLTKLASADIMQDPSVVARTVCERGFTRVAIHVDLDVLAPASFKSLLFTNPDVAEPIVAEWGKLSLAHLTALLQSLDASVEVVGISFSEYMPWDALNLKKMLHSLSFLHEKSSV